MPVSPNEDILNLLKGDMPSAWFYKRFGAPQNPNSPYSSWLKGLQDDLFTQQYMPYALGALADPTQTAQSWDDWLGLKQTGGFDPTKEFANLAPRQRSENPSLYAPPVRWKNSPFNAIFGADKGGQVF